MQIRNGDTVLVRCRVKDNCPMFGPNVRLYGLDCNSDDQTFLAFRSDIVSVEPRALQVGDRVRTPYGTTGEIRVIEDNEAWVKEHDGRLTWNLSQLTRA